MAAPSNLALRFTDENYVTKQGFFDALGSRLVERLWDDVVSYRQAHSLFTKLRTVSQLPFTLTSTEVLKGKYLAFEGKLIELLHAYEEFETYGEEREKFDRQAIYSCLLSASAIEGQKLSEPTLRAMAGGFYQPSVNEQLSIYAYSDFLRQNVGISFPDTESFFVDLFMAMSGTEELTSFYRVDDAVQNQGRAGEYAKYNDIESLAANLEDFVFHDPLGNLPRALLSFYFVQYVEPFASHNALLGIALAKKMLSRGKLSSLAFLLPLEKAYLPSNKMKEAFAETAKTGDFTYVYLYFIDTLTPLIGEMLDSLTNAKREFMRREFRSAPQEAEVKAAPRVLTPVEPEAKKVEVTEIKPPKPEVPVEVVEEEEPLPPEMLYSDDEPEEAPVEVIPSPKPTKVYEEVPVLEAIPFDDKAVLAPRLPLNDKEVRMRARYIVETHPEISKQQALFFASHSTPGRYYTIQDFKKTMKVAYETARTSMDRLAQAKLYKKLRIKNKYVYTYNSPAKGQ